MYRSDEGGYKWTNVTQSFNFRGIGKQGDQTVLYGGMVTDVSWPYEANQFARVIIPKRKPVILSAGYGQIRLNGSQNSQLTILCDIENTEDTTKVELTYDGIPLGLYLNDEGVSGDEVAGDNRFSIVLDIPTGTQSGRFLFGIIARDDTGAASSRWPFFSTN